MNEIYVVIEEEIEKNTYLKDKEYKVVLPYAHLYNIVKKEKPNGNIATYDTTIFCFDTLDKGYDVILLKKNEFIRLSELLENKYDYTNKEMRRAHNVFKMFRANAFKWRSMKMENNVKNF